MTGHRLFPYFLIVTAGVIWGATFSLALIATAQGAHPLGLSAWQVVLTAAFFLTPVFFLLVSIFASVIAVLLLFRSTCKYSVPSAGLLQVDVCLITPMTSFMSLFW